MNIHAQLWICMIVRLTTGIFLVRNHPVNFQVVSPKSTSFVRSNNQIGRVVISPVFRVQNALAIPIEFVVVPIDSEFVHAQGETVQFHRFPEDITSTMVRIITFPQLLHALLFWIFSTIFNGFTCVSASIFFLPILFFLLERISPAPPFLLLQPKFRVERGASCDVHVTVADCYVIGVRTFDCTSQWKFLDGTIISMKNQELQSDLRLTLFTKTAQTKPHLERIIPKPDAQFTPTFLLYEDYWVVNLSQLPLFFKKLTRNKFNRFVEQSRKQIHISFFQ
jgi:hypothetical protein